MTCRLRRRLKKEIRIRWAQRRREISEGLLLIRNVRPSIETKITVVQRGLDCVSMHGKMLFFKSLFPARLHPKGAIEDRSLSLAKRFGKLESGPVRCPGSLKWMPQKWLHEQDGWRGRLIESRDRAGSLPLSLLAAVVLLEKREEEEERERESSFPFFSAACFL